MLVYPQNSNTAREEQEASLRHDTLAVRRSERRIQVVRGHFCSRYNVVRKSQASMPSRLELNSNIVQCRLLPCVRQTPSWQKTTQPPSQVRTQTAQVCSATRNQCGLGARGPGAQGQKGWLTRRCHHDESHCQQEGSACRSRHKTHSVKEFPTSLEAQQHAFRGEGEDV